jgi:protocatechuate 3,4-dioxygenase beta subunit
MKLAHLLLPLLAVACFGAGCSGGTATQSSTGTRAPASAVTACAPTLDDGLSPSYLAGAPERSVVGHGHVLAGTVRSAADCHPIAGAKLEFWTEAPDGGHPDAFRATLFSDAMGNYRFECDMTDHVHMRISATGFATIASNRYHPGGQAEGRFDIVLTPVA